MISLYLCVTYAGAAGGFGGADARRLRRRRIPRALQQQLLPQVPGAHLCFTISSCLAHVALYCVRGLAGSRTCFAVLELKSVALACVLWIEAAWSTQSSALACIWKVLENTSEMFLNCYVCYRQDKDKREVHEDDWGKW